MSEFSKSQRRAISDSLIAWYKRSRRSLSFRDDPTPYAVWVSEVMLQQTRAEVVVPYFERWMSRFPDVSALAAADEDAVLQLWQGLGYYSRARRLQAGARYLLATHGGSLPRTPEELLQVPGIGPYSAGAISSIAYGGRYPVVDGNVIRVLTRFLGLQGDPTRAPLKARLWDIAAELVPAAHPGDFNQGLMELGALVCVPKKPSCIACPWRRSCVALEKGLVERLPELPKRAPPTPLSMLVVFAVHRGRYAVQKLPSDARWWAGLDAFPFAHLPEGVLSKIEIESAASALVGAARISSIEIGTATTHSVTRYRIQAIPCVVRVVDRLGMQDDLRWLLPSALIKLSLPAPHRRLVNRLLSGGASD